MTSILLRQTFHIMQLYCIIIYKNNLYSLIEITERQYYKCFFPPQFTSALYHRAEELISSIVMWLCRFMMYNTCWSLQSQTIRLLVTSQVQMIITETEILKDLQVRMRSCVSALFISSLYDVQIWTLVFKQCILHA